MGNFRQQRYHAKKSKKKSVQMEEKTGEEQAEVEEMAGDRAAGVVDAGDREEETNKKKTMVVLRCEDGMELVVPKEEAIRYGRTMERNGYYSNNDAYTQTRSSHSRGYPLLNLSLASDILSIVAHYSNKKHRDPSWDAAELIGTLDHATLFRLILAAQHLENQGLLAVACNAIASMIADKSPRQIRAMFGIRPPPPAEAAGSTLHEEANNITILDNGQKAEERALRALHIVRCQELTVYDPKQCGFCHTRFCDYNIAFFDLDKESRIGRGPPLSRMPKSSIASSSVNFISLKVCESDVGFPINIFGTVIARDMIDFKCVYLFRREADDSQVITSPDDDSLALVDPHRGLLPEDIIYFEINLKIKCDGGATKDFSRGLTSYNICRLSQQNETTIASLTSRLSTVELEIAHVPRPLEASVTINILKGPCEELTRVAAWSTGNTEARIILYASYEAATGTQMIKVGSSIRLARRVVLVPLREKLVLHLVGQDEDESLVLTLGHCDDEERRVCRMGCSELQVNVSWTDIPEEYTVDWREVVGDVWLLK